jgi:phosphate starvation-inducible PhoH-like protein
VRPGRQHLRTIEAALQVSIAHRHEQFKVDGPKAKRATQAWRCCRPCTNWPSAPSPKSTCSSCWRATAPWPPKPRAPGAAEHPPRRPARAHAHQALYLDNIATHDITFGIGPAGTGKTYLAVACAVDALERSAVQRIVLTRPAVEAGERLGFLPGDLAQKVDPYLRPLYDALYDLMGYDKVQKAFERNALEIAPLAFMRGRTLNNAFVILDEAQNTTPEQMKMFLTRIGFGAGRGHRRREPDRPAQGRAERPDRRRACAQARQGHRRDRFTSADVVRHPLVARIVDAYDAQRGRRSAD